MNDDLRGTPPEPLAPLSPELWALHHACWRVLATWDSLDTAHAPDTGNAEADIGPYRDKMDEALNALR